MSTKKKPVKKNVTKKKPVAKKKTATKRPAKKAVKASAVKSTPAFTMTGNSLTVTFTFNGKRVMKTCLKGTKEFDAAKACIAAGDNDGLLAAFTQVETKLAEKVAKFNESFIEYKDGVLRIDGEPIPPDLNARIMEYEKDDMPYMPLVNFWRNLKLNTSRRALHGLFAFISKNHFPITEDGHFIAYKGVREDFKDCYSGTFDNSPGKVVEMPRNGCDEDPNADCSKGLHVASYHFAHSGYGQGSNKVVECKVHPRDVVSVPFADKAEKMRCCRYEVIGVSVGERAEQVFNPDDKASQVPMSSRHDVSVHG